MNSNTKGTQSTQDGKGTQSTQTIIEQSKQSTQSLDDQSGPSTQSMDDQSIQNKIQGQNIQGTTE